MSSIQIRQIYYSDQTLNILDPGFIAMDNMSNLRPDWMEYWPIRNFLMNSTLSSDSYYGFFSPRFREKTGLDAAQVHDFIAGHDGMADVFLFSPCVDLSAMWTNVFAHFDQEKGNHETLRQLIALITPGFEDLATQILMDSRNTVYCNYFVAKPEFWKLWLGKCEEIYRVAEEDTTELGHKLNAGISYRDAREPLKIFAIERVASWLLATHRYAVLAYDPWSMPPTTASAVKYRKELIQLDALKIAFSLQKSPSYFAEYKELQTRISNVEKKKAKALATFRHVVKKRR
jgi:hypothetical protein